MILGSVVDSDINEKRIAISPDTIKKYITGGFSVQLEKDFGKNSNIDDNELQRLGAKILNKEEIYKTSDIIVKINCPSDSEISLIKDGSVLIGSFFPHLNKDKINKLLKKNIKIFSLELLPRITRAQSMDIVRILPLVAVAGIPIPLPITPLLIMLGKKYGFDFLPKDHRGLLKDDEDKPTEE